MLSLPLRLLPLLLPLDEPERPEDELDPERLEELPDPVLPEPELPEPEREDEPLPEPELDPERPVDELPDSLTLRPAPIDEPLLPRSLVVDAERPLDELLDDLFEDPFDDESEPDERPDPELFLLLFGMILISKLV